jgi:RNA polymerase sigma-32 factor
LAEGVHERTIKMAQTKHFGCADYLALVRRCPRLSREREHELALRWREYGDASARDVLIRSQLSNVVAVARRYRHEASATFEDLIAEGNFGLIQALAKFDPDQGTRFVTYAIYWIRAYILQYLTRSRSLVVSGVQSKLFAKIRHERARVAGAPSNGGDADELVAARLAISPEKMRSLVERLELRDTCLDTELEDSRSGRLMGVVESLSLNPEDAVLRMEAKSQISFAVSQALSTLDARERYVVERRSMAHQEEELSLAEIGRHFRVSRERARQIEARAMRKLRAAFARSGANALVPHPLAA